VRIPWQSWIVLYVFVVLPVCLFFDVHRADGRRPCQRCPNGPCGTCQQYGDVVHVTYTMSAEGCMYSGTNTWTLDLPLWHNPANECPEFACCGWGYSYEGVPWYGLHHVRLPVPAYCGPGQSVEFTSTNACCNAWTNGEQQTFFCGSGCVVRFWNVTVR